MSWSRRTARILAAVLAVPAVVALGACGFEPLYARTTDDSVTAELAAVQIDPIKDRVGQMLQNKLRDALNPNGVPAKPRYILKVTLTETTQETIIQQTAFAARANLTLNVQFQLSHAKTRGGIYSGATTATSSYSFQTASLGTLAGEKDARERAVADAAEQIRSLLGIYFKRNDLDSRRE
jgi:LPS-assembly lipoprotein